MDEEINIVPIAQSSNQLFLMVNEKDANNSATTTAILVDVKNKKFIQGVANALKSSYNLIDVKKEQVPQIFTTLFQTFSEQEVNDLLLKPLTKK
ncbi:MAG: hypothetical protein NZ521_12195 [Flammeovirgaceae bacterium]|nr:hypothetical protein [Flammeovirgaceae bacterium]MDW8288962.1 hypothetical protein [Flammeovirgaceae bacterium]